LLLPAQPTRGADKLARKSQTVACDVTNETSLDNDKDGPFITVTRKQRKKVIVGEKTNTTAFKGVSKKAVFCVSRFEPGTSIETVSDYLSSQGIHVVSCFALPSKETVANAAATAERTHSVSMRVTVTSGAVAKIMSPDIWPEGVSVRKWTFKPRQSSASGSHDV